MTLPALPNNSRKASLSWADPQTLQIAWADGHTSRLNTLELRRACPCAGCTAYQRPDDPFRVLPTVSEQVAPVAIHAVGRYAMNIVWNDGHQTGIYAYDYLRQICPCCNTTARD